MTQFYKDFRNLPLGPLSDPDFTIVQNVPEIISFPSGNGLTADATSPRGEANLSNFRHSEEVRVATTLAVVPASNPDEKQITLYSPDGFGYATFVGYDSSQETGYVFTILNSYCRITRWLNGVSTVLATVFNGSNFPDGTQWECRITPSGTDLRLEIYVDGASFGDVVDTAPLPLPTGGGYVVFNTRNDTNGGFYDLAVGDGGDLTPFGAGPWAKAYVRPYGGGGWNFTQPSVDLPFPSNVAAGDTLLIIAGVRAGTVNALAGWTIVGDAGGSLTDMKVFCKKAVTADAGATVTLTYTTSHGNAYGVVIGRAADPDINPPEAAAFFQDTDGIAPDPPTLTPSGGSKDYLWIAAYFVRTAGLATAYPLTYTKGRVTYNSGGSDANAMGFALKSANLLSDDPGAFTVSNAGDWSAMTIAVNPEGPAATPATPINLGVTNLQATSARLTWEQG